nr:sulfite exporter TauE/SafE family protein [uncultured Eisenbergiella sp.]
MDSEWLFFLYTFLVCIGGGFVQSTTGFGFGIFVMVFFPLYLPVLQAAGLSSLILIFLLSTLVWRYRKYIQWKQAIFPAAVYLIVSTTTIRLASSINLSGINFWLGMFLLLIAIYMAFMNQKITVKANWGTAAVCASLSGTVDGLFSIGGPPMTVYFLALLGNEKLKYLGTIQFFFFITNLMNSFNRIFSGILKPFTLLLVLPGIFGQYIGSRLGNRIVDRIDSRHFQILVYSFLAVSGIFTCISSLF